MADYWKSQARKFCDFCKCWIADNKPSIQFHETGKRHKENVAQKLAQLTKRSVKEKKESIKVDEEMRKMEEAAMKAYMKDMESNPDYTSKLIIDKVEEKKKLIEQQKLAAQEDTDAVIEEKLTDNSDNVTQEERVWYEAKSDEGYTYYWNYLTGESVWEPPKEGYVSFTEQQNLSTCSETEISISSDNKVNESKNEGETDVVDIKEKGNLKTRRKRKNKDCDKSNDDDGSDSENNKNCENNVDDGSCNNPVVMGPSLKPDPYGGWTTVETIVQQPVDLQLPQQEYIEIKVPSLEYEKPQIKFKEKMITSVDSTEGPSTFKKRKFHTHKGNMRRKFGDEDDDIS